MNTVFLFMFLEGQVKIKRYSLVVQCRRFHQVLQRQILHRHLAHIVHFHVELPLILLEKFLLKGSNSLLPEREIREMFY